MPPEVHADDEVYLGLMSGTSLDGIDCAAVRFTGRGTVPSEARLEGFETIPFDSPLAERLRDAAAGESGAAELCDLNFALGEAFAGAAERALETATGRVVPMGRVVAIGSHGQTVRHRPPAPGGRGSTLQIGEAAVIAERCGVDVIADFRVRDVASGGHGAPLAPLFDDLLLRARGHARAIQNIGGMGNVTGLPPAGDLRSRPIAFDTGPGVALIDAAVRLRTDGSKAWDEDGRLAGAGRPDEALVDEWLADPFFAQSPPRSTGRERFGSGRVAEWLDTHTELSTEDAVATLAEVTVRSIADSCRSLPFEVAEVVVCGGGARNPHLVRRLQAVLADHDVRVLDDIGWSGDAREAAAFALLARQHILGHPVDLSWATGAAGPRILGKRVPA